MNEILKITKVPWLGFLEKKYILYEVIIEMLLGYFLDSKILDYIHEQCRIQTKAYRETRTPCQGDRLGVHDKLPAPEVFTWSQAKPLSVVSAVCLVTSIHRIC
jgi:hypothetical protein